MISQTFHRDAALTWYDQGFCVIPVRSDGSKRPSFDWKPFMSQRATRSLTAKWYEQDPSRGVGLICGKISGNLEMTELEGDYTDGLALDKLRVECDARDILWLWDLLTEQGYSEWTANGGIHTVYRISDHDVPGNTKLAMDPTGKITYAETRGEGGFVVVAPTTGLACKHDTFHEDGDNWIVAAGEIGQVPTITWDQREALHAAIKAAFDRRVDKVYEAPAPRPAREMRDGEVKPGDDFDERGDWATILTERGWTYAGQMRGQETWTRPGKDPRQGHSAALGHMGSDNIYVWSGMGEGERKYSKFQFVCFSDFNGDFAATTKFLAQQGYGTPLETRPTSMLRRVDFDYSDLLGRPMTDAENGSETVEVEASPEAPKPRPRIEKWTEVGVARFAGKIFGDAYIQVTEEGSERGAQGWRVFENGVWREDLDRSVRRAMIKISDFTEAQAESISDKAAEAYATNATDENKKAASNASRLLTFAKSIASERGIKAVSKLFADNHGVTRSIKAFDANKSLLALENGTFDLTSMTLKPHDRDDLLTKRMPVTFDAEATCPTWDQAMTAWIPDAEMRDYVQRALGYTLLGDPSEGVFFIPWGKTGCGKSQFIKTIQALFGDFGTTAEASTFRDKTWSASTATNNLHDLMGKRFVSSSETTEGRGLDTELVKRATGDDSVTTRALYQSNITWDPEFVLWMATNYKPVLPADDDAIWRRVKPIHFPSNFSASSERIMGLGRRLINEELAGIFNWLLEGVRKYRERGLSEPAAMSEAVKEYRDENDPVSQFLAEFVEAGRIEVSAEATIEASKLYNVFAIYCDENNIKFRLTPNKFGRIMTSRGFELRPGTNGVKMRVGIGSRWLRDQNTPARS